MKAHNLVKRVETSVFVVAYTQPQLVTFIEIKSFYQVLVFTFSIPIFTYSGLLTLSCHLVLLSPPDLGVLLCNGIIVLLAVLLS